MRTKLKRFKYKLERLLELKAYKEREVEIRLGAVSGECESYKNQISDRLDEKDRAFMDKDSNSSMEDLMQIELYRARMDSENTEINRKLKDGLSRRDKVQKELIEASRDRKVFDKHKEKKAAEYYKDQLNEEHNVVDDINTGNAARKIEDE